MVASQSPCGCEKITNWPTPIQTSCFIGPYNLHYLLFSGIGTLLCHHPYYFCSQSSQTLFGIGAGQPKITAVARCLFRHENTFDFAGGKGVKLEGGLSCCLEHFLEYTYFSRLVEVIFRMLQQEGILYAHASIRPLEEPQRHFLWIVYVHYQHLQVNFSGAEWCILGASFHKLVL